MTWDEWEDQCWQKMLEEARAAAPPFDRAKFELEHPVKTSRDGYGWRGLKGTSWIGPREPTKSDVDTTILTPPLTPAA